MRTAASRLPDLPDSLFGWIPVLFKISDEEVLASGGLDAFVVRLLPYHWRLEFTLKTDIACYLLQKYSFYCSTNTPSTSFLSSFSSPSS